MVWRSRDDLSPSAAATSSTMCIEGLPPGTASYCFWHMGHPTTMTSASFAASCLSAISGAPTFLLPLPQHPGSLPTGSQPMAFTMSMSWPSLSMQAHPGSTETFSGRLRRGSLSMLRCR